MRELHQGGEMRNTQTQYQYYAAIGERVIGVRGRNIWEAAEKAACGFSGSVSEGLMFFRGQVQMQVARPGGRTQAGDYAKWMSIFTAQGRSTRRWEKVRAGVMPAPAETLKRGEEMQLEAIGKLLTFWS